MDRSPDDMQEEAVAEALGVEPEYLEVPPGIRKGIVLFELEDGSFGFRPMVDKMSMMDTYLLCERVQVGIKSDMVAQRILKAETEVIKTMQQAQKAEAEKPKLFLPQVGRKK